MTTKTSHLVLKLKDELSGPAGKAAGALGKVGDAGKGLKKLSGASAEVQRLSQDLGKLQGQLGKVESFRGIQADFAAARTRFRSAQTEVQRLAREMAAVDKPTQKMATAFARAQREVRSAAQAFERQRTAIVAAKRAMETAGVPIDKLAAAEKRLKSAIDQTNTSLSFQKRVEARAHHMAPSAHAPLVRGGAASAAYGAAGGVLVGMGGPLLGAAGAGFAIKQVTESSLSLEKTMTEVARATDASGAALKVYEQKVLDIARATGKTKEEIGAMLASAGFAGRPAHELVRFTEYASKATTAWGTTAEDTGQALAEIGNIFRAHQARIEEIGDAVNTVADGAAASEPDLLEFIRRAGAVGDQAGFTAEQVISFGAAFKEIGTRTDVAATAFNALVNSLTLGAEFTKHAEEGFKALGINIKKFQKSFVKKPLETTLELLEKITAIKDPLKRASILNDIYGKEYGDDIARLTGNMEGLHRILGMVADRTKYLGSVQKNFDTAINTDVNKIARATQALDVLAARAGNAFKVIAGGAAQEVNSLVDSIEKGDSLFQRVLGRYDAQLKKAAELEGRLRPDGKIDMGEPTFDATSTDNWFDRNAPWLSGKRWREDLDSWLGTSGDEAARKGREAAIEEHFRKQREMVNERDRLRKRNADAGGNRVVFDEKTGRYMARDVAEAELSHIEEVVRRTEQRNAQMQQELAALRAVVRSQERLRDVMGGGSMDNAEPVGSGLTTFGFGRHGMPASETAPLPPRRPESLGGKPVPEDGPPVPATQPIPIAAPTVDTTALDEAKAKAEEAGNDIKASLDVVARPQVDVSSFADAESFVDRLLRKISLIGPASRQAQAEMGRAVGSSFKNRQDGSLHDGNQ